METVGAAAGAAGDFLIVVIPLTGPELGNIEHMVLLFSPPPHVCVRVNRAVCGDTH